MWSLGCVIAELFLGWPLYPGASEYDQVGPGSSGIHKKHFLYNMTRGWGNRVFPCLSNLASRNSAFLIPLFPLFLLSFPFFFSYFCLSL